MLKFWPIGDGWIFVYAQVINRFRQRCDFDQILRSVNSEGSVNGFIVRVIWVPVQCWKSFGNAGYKPWNAPNYNLWLLWILGCRNIKCYCNLQLELENHTRWFKQNFRKIWCYRGNFFTNRKTQALSNFHHTNCGPPFQLGTISFLFETICNRF